jgi:hypothetical protein
MSVGYGKLADALAAGDVTLLAALLLGVAVAAAAVVAFLHMTGSGKRTGNAGRAPFVDEESEYFPDPASGDVAGTEAEDAMQGTYPFAPGRISQHDTVPNDREAASALERTIPLAAVSVELAQPSGSGRAEPRLYGISGDFSGRHFRITDRPLALGRDPTQCGLVFRTDAAEISRKHCSLSYHAEKGLFLLQDHGSSNGTFLHGRRLEPNKTYELRPGDRFSLSGDRHWFEVRL